jgi:glutamyl-tRNA synthetase
VDADVWTAWLAEDDRQLAADVADRLAAELGIDLPEIDVDDFRRAGYLPEVLINYLALLGWSPGENVERFDRDFLLARFDLDRVSRSPAKFDRDKLLAFNLDALQEMEPAAFVDRLEAHARRTHPEYLERFPGAAFSLFAAANQKRSKTLEDPFRDAAFFLVPDDGLEYERSKNVRKALRGGDPSGAEHLAALRPILAGLEDFSPAAVEAAVTGYAEAHAGGRLGRIAQPLRIAVSGVTVSPPIFETLALLGRDAVVRRIERCLAAHPELCST